MKTPTLIVRLVGLYLVAQSGIALLQVQKMGTLAAGMGMRQNPVPGDIQAYAVIGLLVGLAATAFAGPLARMLTFDSGPKGRSEDS